MQTKLFDEHHVMCTLNPLLISEYIKRWLIEICDVHSSLGVYPINYGHGIPDLWPMSMSSALIPISHLLTDTVCIWVDINRLQFKMHSDWVTPNWPSLEISLSVLIWTHLAASQGILLTFVSKECRGTCHSEVTSSFEPCLSVGVYLSQCCSFDHWCLC